MEQILQTQVDLAGLMKVLGDNLYSTPNVALRELVQNGHDSCHRRRLEDTRDFVARVTVVANPGDRTLTIEDTGAGLTDQEIKLYLATVGSGYTRHLRDGGHNDQGLIGYFGLGFLSAFVVSDRTVVHTCSYQNPDQAWVFASRSGQTYTIRSGEPRPVGTKITLHLKSTFQSLASPDVVRSLLRRYCSLLPLPIFCADEQVNREPPPWRDEDTNPMVLQRNALDFASRFETNLKPLFTLPLPANGADAQGLIWVQSASTYGSSDNRRVWVFVRGMMVTDDERELLPSWAVFCGAVVESDQLTPTASRESLQKDETYKTLQRAVRDALLDGFSQLATKQKAVWERFLLRHNEALLGSALADPALFSLLGNDLTVPTSEGNLTLPALAARSQGRIHVNRGDKRGFEELLFRALKVPIIDGTRYAALPFARLYAQKNGIEIVVMGTDTGNQALFHKASLGSEVDEQLRAWFAAEDVEVIVSRFEPDFIPLVLVPDREVELKRRIESDEANARIASAALSLARMFTASVSGETSARLYVNTSCQAIRALATAPEASRQTALTLLRALVSMNSEWSHEGRFMEVDEAMQKFCTTIETILTTPIHS